MIRLTVYISKEEQNNANAFLKYYEPYGYQGTAEANRPLSRRLKLTTTHCRFCKRTREQTTFTQDTHLISNLLGQNTYYSHDECDECNAFFKAFENDLANYLGTSRVFNHIMPHMKAPGFSSGNRAVNVKNYGNDFIYVENAKPEKEDFKVDMENGNMEIAIKTAKFVPENVYRALLKMALGILPENNVAEYDMGFKLLMNMNDYPSYKSLKKVVIAPSDIVLGRPFACLFQKRPGVNEPLFPQHLFCLYVGNLMMQILIPGRIGAVDPPSNVRMPFAPYYQLNAADPHDDVIHGRILEDLQATEPRQNDNGIHMNFSTENLAGVQLDFDLKKMLDELDKRNR